MTLIERFHGSLTAMLAAAILAGCAGSPPTSPLAIEVSQSTSCVESIENQPAFAPLRAKSPALGDMSSTHLGDTAKPTPEEQALARDYLAAVSACEPKSQSMPNPKEQAAGRAILTTWHEQEQLYVALASGRLTWGQFNRMTEALGRRMDRQLRTAMAAAGS
jgi:hypothetical protein